MMDNAMCLGVPRTSWFVDYPCKADWTPFLSDIVAAEPLPVPLAAVSKALSEFGENQKQVRKCRHSTTVLANLFTLVQVYVDTQDFRKVVPSK
jgi:hypothetical protein